jgi:hypothetical protein
MNRVLSFHTMCIILYPKKSLERIYIYIEMNRRVNFYDPALVRGTTEGRLMRDYATL